MIYDQLKPDMLQSSVLLRDTDTLIASLDDGTPDGKLRSRLCAAIFLIGKLPTDGPAATGVRANPTMLADLLVDDLTAGSASLRRRIPDVLQRPGGQRHADAGRRRVPPADARKRGVGGRYQKAPGAYHS